MTEAGQAAPGVSSPAPGPAIAVAPLLVVGGVGDPVSARLQYEGVSPLYQGYFNTEDWVAALATDLGPCLSGTADVLVSYDTDKRIGRILVSTTASELGCLPTLSPDGTLDLTPLVPLGQALARYRDTIAAQRDIRIASFRAGVRLLHNTDVCEFKLGGQFPPDGSTFSSCIRLGGHETCLDDRHVPVQSLALTGLERNTVASCLSR